MKKNLKTEQDTTWRTKGHTHMPKDKEPVVCYNCNGLGYFPDTHEECPICEGLGELYE
jgi:hypothetical protein